MELKKKARSRSYPGYGLQECVAWAESIRQQLGSGSHDRESVARALGSRGVNGASARKVASLAHFGLLDRVSHGYSLSPLSDSVLKPIEDSEQRHALMTAFMNPALYREVMACYSVGEVLPRQLATILCRKHRIQDSVSADAARILLESARFSGIIDEGNRIVRSPEDGGAHPSTPDSTGETAGVIPGTEDAKLVRPQEEFREESGDCQRFRFALTRGRSAELVVPCALTGDDIRLMNKQMELLQLQSEIMQSNTEDDNGRA